MPLPSPGDLPEPRDRTWVACIAGGFFTIWATKAVPFMIFLINTLSTVIAIFSNTSYVGKKKRGKHKDTLVHKGNVSSTKREIAGSRDCALGSG